MENLRKVISLRQASLISGYHQDYLSSLIRKNEIKGEKKGGNWFTTEGEIKSYIFRQKIKHKKGLIKYLLSFFKRINKSFVYAFIYFAIFSLALYFFNKDETKINADKLVGHISSQSEEQLQFNELKF